MTVAIAAVVMATAALTATLVGGPDRFSMIGGRGMMRGGAGMMGRSSALAPASGLQPGDAGFVAGTAAAPRVIRIVAGPGYTFSPSSISVARGETITFEVTAVGPNDHEFMVGPADRVAADEEGTPEIADIGMMQTRSLTYAFEGSGPYAFRLPRHRPLRGRDAGHRHRRRLIRPPAGS